LGWSEVTLIPNEQHIYEDANLSSAGYCRFTHFSARWICRGTFKKQK